MIGNRRKPLTEGEAKELCPKCGHTRDAHHNPDDRCCVLMDDEGMLFCNCGYYFYGVIS